MSKLRDSSQEGKVVVVHTRSGGVTELKWLLLVEDHAVFREGLALLLKWRTGLDNVQSASIAEARRTLCNAEEEPVCAVVDLDLPDGDGIELLERLRGLPVLALVSDRSLERCVRALEAGADEVLHKGESSEKIQTAVEQFVGGSRTRDYYSD
jgi:DNA-binding NarL/FixJ family response regulator